MKHKSKWLITELWIMKSLMINLLISIQLTLVVSNTWYIELSTIYPVLWSLSTWLKQTFLGILKFDTSNFFLCRTNFLAHWKVLCRYLKKLSKFTIPFPFFNFSSQIAATVPTRMNKDTSNLFFIFAFSIECFGLIFWSLEYSIKVLFQDYFTENHGTFERKTYQRNYCW